LAANASSSMRRGRLMPVAARNMVGLQ
jgi:hypothetical protein